jgi:hypothetical protein
MDLIQTQPLLFAFNAKQIAQLFHIHIETPLLADEWQTVLIEFSWSPVEQTAPSNVVFTKYRGPYFVEHRLAEQPGFRLAWPPGLR